MCVLLQLFPGEIYFKSPNKSVNKITIPISDQAWGRFFVNILPPINQNTSTHTFRSDKNKGEHTTKLKLFHIVLMCPKKVVTHYCLFHVRKKKPLAPKTVNSLLLPKKGLVVLAPKWF